MNKLNRLGTTVTGEINFDEPPASVGAGPPRTAFFSKRETREIVCVPTMDCPEMNIRDKDDSFIVPTMADVSSFRMSTVANVPLIANEEYFGLRLPQNDENPFKKTTGEFNLQN